MTPIECVATFLIAVGLIFSLGTVVGILRLPDFYTRSHAASKGDTLSSLFLLTGIILFIIQDFSLVNVIVCVKILFIIAFLFIASPTAAHVLLRAAYRSGAQPWTKDDEEEGEE